MRSILGRLLFTCGRVRPGVSIVGGVITAFLIVPPLSSAQSLAQEQSPPPIVDLTTLFDIGALVLDTNGDSVPDFVNASLVTGDPASPAELRAAAEIAARLGFETMAMDLPIARGSDGDGIPIVIGRGGLAASGLANPGVDPTSLDAGEGAVAVREVDGRRWVLVVGGDDDGLLAAARLFAGVLPHTRTLSAPALSEVGDDLREALEAAGVEAESVRLSQAPTRMNDDGVTRLVAEVDVAPTDVTAAAEALRALADAVPAGADQTSGATPGADEAAAASPGAAATPAPTPGAADAPALPGADDPGADQPADDESGDDESDESAPLAYAGLGSVEVRIASGPTIRLSGRAEPDAPGPISGRPGRGAKEDLDLSSLYTNDGLLGDSDNNVIPDRVDALLVPGSGAIEALPDVAARLGLESTGLVVPLVQPAETLERPSSHATLILAGTDNRLTDQLADSGRIDLASLAPGEGLIQLVPEAFGEKPSLVVTGADERGARRALEHLAFTFPHLDARGKDRPTVEDVEGGLWDALSGHSPVGQAAIGMYKLDRIAAQLADRDLAAADVLVSVVKADAGLEAFTRQRAEALGADRLEVVIDDRDVQNAAPIFDESVTIPSEVDRFREVLEERVLPSITSGEPVTLHARLSEPPEIRRRLEAEARQALLHAGADPLQTEVRVLSAFKQGYSWLYEDVRPRLDGLELGEILIRFRRNDPPEDWPQQAINTPVRWLHEIFPIDEILARELDLGPEQIRFEETLEGPTYEVVVTDAGGGSVLVESFDPKWVLRPYFDRFQDYEHVRVTTGWIEVTSGSSVLADERIATDPESFWDHFQSRTLPAVYDYVMDRHEGIPRGGNADAPFFGELVVEVELSEPDYRLELDNELHSPMDAIHEEVYFGTIEFFDVLGRNSRGEGLTFPGRIIPRMRPKSDGTAGTANIMFSGFATSRPAVVVAYEERSGATGEIRLDIPRITMERPSARLARVRAGESGVSHLGLRVRVDTDADERESLLSYGTPVQVDERMVSAEQIEATVGYIEELRAAGLYESSLAFPGLGSIEVWAEWTHEQDPESRRTARLAANGTPEPLPDWRSLLSQGWSYSGERIVQWDTPIPPPEGHRMLAEMGSAFDQANVYKVGESYLGKTLWAMDLMPPVEATHWSHAKATTFKPTVIYSARQHANEVSSTSHVLRHAELLLTDPEQRRQLDKVNVVIHPFTNADGAQLAYDLYEVTPDFILHAGYLGSLGIDATSGSREDHPIYPEAPVRGRIWATWLPDIFLNPHGYPSHQVVQLFSEYTGLVRRGRVTERNWGFNKGWFMPGFGYIDNPDFPRHKDAAFELRDYITRGINSNRDVFDMNQRNYARYERYGAQFDPDVFRLPMVDSVLIQMPLKGSTGEGQGGYNPRVTIWSGTTEAPDETAYGDWMQLIAKAGLSWDQAILDYLYEGNHEVNRSGSTFFGGVTLRMNRPRPPEKKDEDKPVT